MSLVFGWGGTPHVKVLMGRAPVRVGTRGVQEVRRLGVHVHEVVACIRRGHPRDLSLYLDFDIIVPSMPFNRQPVEGRRSSWPRVGSRRRTLDCRRGFGDGQRQATELATAGNTNSPRQLRFVARAVVANFQARRAVGSAAVTLRVAFMTGEAVVGGAAGGSSSPSFAGSGVTGC